MSVRKRTAGSLLFCLTMGTAFLKEVSVHSLRLLARGPLWVAAKENAREPHLIGEKEAEP